MLIHKIVDIINVNSINGPADVVYLQEDNNEIQKELYWRFFYEYRSSELNVSVCHSFVPLLIIK